VPVTGRKPKPEDQRRNHHKPTYEWVEVPDVPFKGAPKLAPRQPNGEAWPTRTKQWWAAVSSMPHCVLWTETDWQYAFDTALVAAKFHNGEMRMAAELRNREKLLGNTFDSRRDLRIRYVDPAPAESVPTGKVSSLEDRRRRLVAP
jgi:hypothetical protein